MVWLGWLIIASIALLAGASISAWRRSHLNSLDLQPGKGRSPESYSAPVLPDSSRNARAPQRPVEEAATDRLTGLMTQDYFMKALDGEWQRSMRAGGRFCVIMIDLDRFKQVNERTGRPEGDRVLTAAAALLEARARQPSVVARYADDEFAILMPETNAQQAYVLAETLAAAVESDDFLRAHKVTGSFGIAAFPDHGRTQQEILKSADSRMYLAKLCGGNCVKVASRSPQIANGQRNELLLEAYLERLAKGTISTAPHTVSDDQHEFERKNPLWDTIVTLAYAIEAKDPDRQGHSEVVSRLAAQIAIQTGLSHAEVEEIRLAGLVHDIGKLYVPESVYNKPDLLTAKEFQLMKGHPAWSEKILEPLNVEAIGRIVRHHHERYDGRGYPEGLAGDKIPLGARIVAVAESFQSMVSVQLYRRPRTIEDAVAEIRRCSGSQFDPKIVMAFLDWLRGAVIPEANSETGGSS